MVRRRRFDSWNDWRRLRVVLVPDYRTGMSRRERQIAFRKLGRTMIILTCGAAVLLMFIAYAREAALDDSPVALQRAVRHGNPLVRERALRIGAAGTHIGSAGHASLVRILNADSASRGYAAMALVQTGDSSRAALRALRHAFGSSTGMARGEALLALISLEPVCENRRFIEQGFHDPDGDVRILALQAWAVLTQNASADCRNLPPGVVRMLHDPLWRVRSYAVQLVLDHGTPLERELLRPLLANSQEEVRRTVREGLKANVRFQSRM